MREVYNFNIPTIIITVVYAVFFLSVLFAMQGKNKVKLSSILGVTIGFLFLYLFFVLNYLFEFKSISPDSIAYSKIINDFWSNYNTWSLGVRLYSLINFIPFKLSFQYPSLFILFNIFFYFTGITMIGKSFILYLSVHNKSVSKNFFFYLFIFTSVYPVALIVIPTLLREGSMVMFLGITCYYMVLIYSSKKINIQNLIYFIIALILLTLIRPIGGISFIVAIFALYILQKIKTLTLKQFVYLSIGIVAFLIAIQYLVNLFYNLPFSFDWLMQYRKSHVLLFGSESYGGELKFQTLGEVLKNSFLLFNQYLFSPLPILIPIEITMNKVIPTFDALYIIVLFIPIILFLKNKIIRKILFFAAILIFIPALFETHISGAYRHRMNAVLILIPVFVYSFNKLMIVVVKIFNQKR